MTSQTELGYQREAELVAVASAAPTTGMRSSAHTGFASLAVAAGVLVALVIGASGSVGGGDHSDVQVGVASTPSEPTPSEPTQSEAAPPESTPAQPTPAEPTPAERTPAEPTIPQIVGADIPADLAAAFAAEGTHLTPPPPGSAAPDADTLQSAIDLARTQFGPAGTAIAIPATLTVEGYHTGDENSPLAIEDRSVIAVQITGLSMPPHGKYGDPPASKSEYSTELVVFVDATTGEFLLASSVR